MEDLSSLPPDLPEYMRSASDHPFMATLRTLPPAEAIGFVHWAMSECENEQVRYDMDSVLIVLPVIDLEHARGVYRAYAESEDLEDRYEAASLVPELLRNNYDHDLGLELLGNLLADPEEAVRNEAWWTLRTFIGDSRNEEDLRRIAGVTGFEATLLLTRYSEAEQTAAARRAEAVAPVPEQRRHRWLGKIATWLNG